MKKIIYILVALFFIALVSTGASLVSWGDTDKIEELKSGSLSPNYIDDNGEATGISSGDFFAGILGSLNEKDAEISALQIENNLIKSELCKKDNSYGWCE